MCRTGFGRVDQGQSPLTGQQAERSDCTYLQVIQLDLRQGESVFEALDEGLQRFEFGLQFVPVRTRLTGIDLQTRDAIVQDREVCEQQFIGESCDFFEWFDS